MAETKRAYYPLASAFGSISSTWQYFSFALGQGLDSLGQRIGKKIAITTVSFSGLLHGGQSNLATDDKVNSVRMVVMDCRLNNQALGTLTPLSGIGISDPIYKTTAIGAMYSKIHYSKVINLASPGPDSTGYMPAIRHVKFRHVYRKPLIINYQDTSSTYPDKMPFICALSDSVLAPNPGFTNGYIKLTYKDL